MNMLFVAAVVLWALGGAIYTLSTRKQIEANPGRRVPYFYSQNHADPARVRLLRAGGMVLLSLSAFLFIQLWGFAGLIPMVIGSVPAIVLILRHNSSIQR